MKHTAINAAVLAALAAFTAACSHEEADTYDTSRSAINIGFGSVETLLPEARYNFSETSGEKGVTFYARISGVPAAYDRTFTIQPVGGDIELTRGAWRTAQYVIPAGQVGGEYTLWFDSSLLPDPAAFTTGEGSLTFAPVPNEHFAMGAQGHNTLEFKLVNYLAQPENWDAVPNNTQYPLKNYFGDYSAEKYRFMLDNGIPVKCAVSRTQAQNSILDGETTVFSHGYANFLKQKMQLALQEYNSTHPQPLCDSYGNPITF